MSNTNQVNVKDLSDEDVAQLAAIRDERGMTNADVVSAGLRLLQTSFAEAEGAADPSREDCRAVEKELGRVSERVCAVLRGYAAKAAAEAEEARSGAEKAVEASRKAADGLAAAKAEADELAEGLRAERGAALEHVDGLRAERDALAAARAAKEEAERKLLESVDAERNAVAEAADLRTRCARLEGRLESLGRADA